MKMQRAILRRIVLLSVVLLLIPATGKPVKAGASYYKDVSVKVGKSIVLKVPGYRNSSLRWESYDKKYATVNASGKVTGKKKGVACIYATIRGHKYPYAEFYVEVKAKSKKKKAYPFGIIYRKSSQYAKGTLYAIPVSKKNRRSASKPYYACYTGDRYGGYGFTLPEGKYILLFMARFGKNYDPATVLTKNVVTPAFSRKQARKLLSKSKGRYAEVLGTFKFTNKNTRENWMLTLSA